ncbi:MAG: threonine synthase [Eubacteriales bacterium]
MKYTSTRSEQSVWSAQAIKQGLAPDGGLFMPAVIPTLTEEMLQAYRSLSYPALAAKIMGLYLSDYTEAELLADTTQAYGAERFPDGAAPVVRLDEGLHVMELWHGPTAAFKDMALQIMPRLFVRALGKTGETRTALILVATSGDTGKAALEGYADVGQVKIQVFYPSEGVSTVQKLQMMTQGGRNVSVQGIRGNFDDAQSGVKHIFSSEQVARTLSERGTFLSSANSINWGRLVPQVVYYVHGYCQMVNQGAIHLGEPIDVCVPTGNFGNIFAAYLAKEMGLPIHRLICASNANHVLTEFLERGVYDRNRPFYHTMSPSMDILVSSNVERLLYLLCGQQATAALMTELASRGGYRLGSADFARLRESFVGYYADEAQTAACIKDTFQTHGYLCDTHTAVALHAAEEHRKVNKGFQTLVVSTASPYKFAADVYASLTGTKPRDELAALAMLQDATACPPPLPLQCLDKRTVRFDGVIDPSQMTGAVLDFA